MTETDFTAQLKVGSSLSGTKPNSEVKEEPIATKSDVPKESPTKHNITKDTTIEEAILINPMATEVFMDVGLGCSSCFMAEVETIEQGLLAHGFNDEGVEMVVEELNRDYD